ncbi:unnamed protein product [Tenebrio molitor]|nr:unnamed protein product [Tenebrio molitor]
MLHKYLLLRKILYFFLSRIITELEIIEEKLILGFIHFLLCKEILMRCLEDFNYYRKDSCLLRIDSTIRMKHKIVKIFFFLVRNHRIDSFLIGRVYGSNGLLKCNSCYPVAQCTYIIIIIGKED